MPYVGSVEIGRYYKCIDTRKAVDSGVAKGYIFVAYNPEIEKVLDFEVGKDVIKVQMFNNGQGKHWIEIPNQPGVYKS